MRRAKLSLLEELEVRMGPKMLSLNDIIPTWMTESELHRRLIKKYRQGSSPFVGQLYPNEDYAEPLAEPKYYGKLPGKFTK